MAFGGFTQEQQGQMALARETWDHKERTHLPLVDLQKKKKTKSAIINKIK